jgi:hypothetical protein
MVTVNDPSVVELSKRTLTGGRFVIPDRMAS